MTQLLKHCNAVQVSDDLHQPARLSGQNWNVKPGVMRSATPLRNTSSRPHSSSSHWTSSVFRIAVVVTCLWWTCLSSSVSSEKKVAFTEVVFDSAVEDIQWVGSQFKTVLCRTSSGRLYRSTDSGRKWTDISNTLKSAVKEPDSSAAIRIDTLYVNPVDRSIVVLAGKSHIHFISRDAAQTFRQLSFAGSIHGILFHPKRGRWALMSSWTAACDALTRSTATEPCRHDLFVTRDLGTSWRAVARYVVQYSWGDEVRKAEDHIYFTQYSKPKLLVGGQSKAAGWSDTVDFYVAPSPTTSPRRLVPQGNKFLVSNGYIFVAKALDPIQQTVALMVSTDGGATFNAARLPVALQERSYTILDTSENAVMLHVNHGHVTRGGVAAGDIYISDAAGLQYSLSLPRNVRTGSGECEFDRISSLDGVYMANFRMDPTSPTGSASSAGSSLSQEDPDDDEDVPSETAVQRRHRMSRRGKDEVIVRTAISFDKGAVWSYLRPPRVDSRGTTVTCGNKPSWNDPPVAVSRSGASSIDLIDQTTTDAHCSLNLHGITNYHRYAPFYSLENAVGVVMGTGNVGSSLRYEEDQVNTYLSRDGGLTWIEAHKGAFIYEFGDHGGLIVMAHDSKQTKQVVFSWNEGHSWYDFDLGEQPLNVDNIIIEPNSSSVEFLLYGTRDMSGVLYHLDFNTLGQPECKGVWAADSVSSDYETWKPTDGRSSDTCILGKEVIYTRRKPTSECFNGHDFQRPVVKRNCSCTERDYECTFGFTRALGSLTCVVDDSALTQLGCTTSGVFFAEAYRKIPGDTCEGGWTPPKVSVMCPAHSPFSYRAKRVLYLYPSLVGLLVLCAWFRDPNVFQKFLPYGVQEMGSKAKYAILRHAPRFTGTGDEMEPGPYNTFGGGSGSHPPHLGYDTHHHTFPHYGAGPEGAPHMGNFNGFSNYNVSHADGGLMTEEDALNFIQDEQKLPEEEAPPLLDFSATQSDIRNVGHPFYTTNSGGIAGSSTTSGVNHDILGGLAHSGSSGAPPDSDAPSLMFGEPIPHLAPPPGSSQLPQGPPSSQMSNAGHHNMSFNAPNKEFEML